MLTQFLTDQCFVLQSRKWANTKEVVDKGVILQLDFESPDPPMEHFIYS